MTKEMVEIINRIRVNRIKARDKTKELKSITSRLEDDRKKLEDLENHERYFYLNLSRDANFEVRKDFAIFRECLPDLTMKYKRIFVIINTLREFLKKNSLSDRYGVDTKALTKIVKCYLDDLSILKKRYNCPRVQLPKIAGLMMNLIVKYRPIIPFHMNDNPATDINEIFAIYHALCICSDFSDGAELVIFEQTVEHSLFYKDMIYLLHRNYTPECLIMTLKVLCLYQFRSFLKKEVDG